MIVEKISHGSLNDIRPDFVAYTPKHKMLTKHNYVVLQDDYKILFGAMKKDHNFVVSPDTDQCPDILQCDEFASCIKILTDFACQCNDGFQGNGQTCEGTFFTYWILNRLSLR